MGFSTRIIKKITERKKIETKDSFDSDFEKYSNILEDERFLCREEDIYRCMNEATSETDFDSHYIYHTAWATRKVLGFCPDEHIDISSSLYFVTQISASIPTVFYDYRPADINLSGLECKKADLNSLPLKSNTVKSLSCMHVIEHIGLGRYGDPIDPKGDIKAISELIRVLDDDGDLLIVLPVGHEAKIQFNAHRIYSFNLVLELFSQLKLIDFSLVTDNHLFIEKAVKNDVDEQIYGCGCFHFRKK